MAKFVFVYHGGGKPSSEEEGAKVMAAWMAWLQEIEAADPGAPFAPSVTVHAGGTVTDGGGANPATGYSIIEAADPAEAASMASGCPIFEAGGNVEVCEVMQM